MKVLGIEIGSDLPLRWRDWLMPREQPYVVPRALALDLYDGSVGLDLEVIDAFGLYAIPSEATVVVLDRASARRLPSSVRRSQRAAHRWPTADIAADVDRTIRVVASRHRPSRHDRVSPATWVAAGRVLPRARRISGSFPSRSGPNGFGAVMAAAGIEGVEHEWTPIEEFEAWLAAHTEPIGRGHDDEPGVVMVWRAADGTPQHAAVTLGDGWLLQKHSQAWMSPTTVLGVREGMLVARARGSRVHRHRLR